MTRLQLISLIMYFVVIMVLVVCMSWFKIKIYLE